MARMRLDELRVEPLRLAEIKCPEGEEAPSGHQHRIQARAFRRGPERRQEGAVERKPAGGDPWQASQSGGSIEHILTPASAGLAGSGGVGAAVSAPALEVDFSACVAPMARR